MATTIPIPQTNKYDTSAAGSQTIVRSSAHKLDMLQVQIEIDTIEQIKMDDSFKSKIKSDLVNALTQKMLSDDRITFTQQFDPIQNRRIFRAYTYIGDKQVISVLKNRNHLEQPEIEKLHDWFLQKGYNIPLNALSDIVGEIEKRLENKK